MMTSFTIVEYVDMRSILMEVLLGSRLEAMQQMCLHGVVMSEGNCAFIPPAQIDQGSCSVQTEEEVGCCMC
jgi:hypothetical protein